MPKLRLKLASLSLGILLSSFLGGVFTIPRVVEQVYAAQQPQAVFTVSKQKGSLLEIFSFDATDSVDSQGRSQNLSYRWDFGDGESAQGKKVTHAFRNTGTFAVGLRITDNNGIFATTSMQICVVQPLEPHLELVVTPTTGNTGDSFKFQAQAVSFIGSSQDQLLVRWDFDGDGNFDTEFKNPKEVTHVYNQAGLYTPVVELKDLDGSTSRRSGYTVYNGNYPDRRQLGRVLVNRGAELNLNAAFTVSPTGGSVQTQFYFDASASISGRGGLMYRWDFEGDGNFDTPWQNEAKASHIYSYDGEKSVILQIKDKNGAIVRAVRKIAIDQLNVRPQVDFNVQVLGLALNRKAPVITSGSEVRFIPILREY